jgi:hypothetical protein
MSNSKYKIIWEKWKDPFGSDSEDDIASIADSLARGEEYDEDEVKEVLSSLREIRSKIILTPLGAIPYNENTAAGKIFNFWTGHTNFSITNSISDIIEESDGVETLDVFTRYRFRISIGKAFQDSSVMRSINNQVYSYLE